MKAHAANKYRSTYDTRSQMLLGLVLAGQLSAKCCLKVHTSTHAYDTRSQLLLGLVLTGQLSAECYLNARAHNIIYHEDSAMHNAYDCSVARIWSRFRFGLVTSKEVRQLLPLSVVRHRIFRRHSAVVNMLTVFPFLLAHTFPESCTSVGLLITLLMFMVPEPEVSTLLILSPDTGHDPEQVRSTSRPNHLQLLSENVPTYIHTNIPNS
jgi:hypothetical protein